MSPERQQSEAAPHAIANVDIRSCDFFRQLADMPCIQAIYLHGSRSRGDYRENSDIDLAIYCPDASDQEWQQVEAVIRNANLLLKIDVIRLDKLAPDYPFLKHIHDTKSLLYYRTASAHLETLRIKLDYFEHELSKLEERLAHADLTNTRMAEHLMREFHYKIDILVRSVLRRGLLVAGIREYAPILILRYAVHTGWITNRLLWQDMYDAWQYTRERCAPEVQRDILKHLPEYTAAMRALFEKLKQVESEASQFLAKDAREK